jgi:oxygen-dependent protoporphyrinogen oxidase
MADVVVVGAGIAGLACAFDLVSHDPALDVVVLEADDRVGGKIRTTAFAGLAVDEAADAFLARVPWARDLCDELGLATELVSPAQQHAYIYSYGALRRIPTPNTLGIPLDLDVLDASGIVSAGAVAHAREDLTRTVDPVTDRLRRTGGDESIGALIRRRLGPEINDRLVDPLIGGIYAGSTDELSLECSAPLFAAAAGRDASLIRSLSAARDEVASSNTSPVFYSHPRGVGHVTDELARRLGRRVHLGTPVRAIARNGHGYRVHTADPSSPIDATAIVVATPTGAASSLLSSVAPVAAERCALIDYSSVVLITIAVPRRTITHPLDGSGFLVPKCEGRSITACSWSSSKWAHLASDEYAIMRVSMGHVGDEHPLSLSDDVLVSRTMHDLRDVMGTLGDPDHVRVSRWPRSFPQYRPGHRALIESITEALRSCAPRVVLTGSAYGGIGIPTTILQARQSAERVRVQLSA